VILSRVGPGVFFALFGAAVVTYSLHKGLEFNEQKSVPSTEAQGPAPATGTTSEVRKFTWGVAPTPAGEKAARADARALLRREIAILNNISHVLRADLPDQDFLKGKIWMTCGDGDSEGKPCKTRFDGKYLQMFAIEGLTEMFPNPEGGFDTASYLWLWAHQQQWRWFAFQTIDCHHYTTRYSRNNCKIIEKLPAQDLIYHRVSGGILDIAPFTEAYALSKEDE